MTRPVASTHLRTRLCDDSVTISLFRRHVRNTCWIYKCVLPAPALAPVPTPKRPHAHTRGCHHVRMSPVRRYDGVHARTTMSKRCRAHVCACVYVPCAKLLRCQHALGLEVSACTWP
eukprot:3282591-Pleurochrysis_carterae.AAC.1